MEIQKRECIVGTRKKFMIAYVSLYIISLCMMIVSFIVNMVSNQYILSANIIFLIGMILALIATIIWAIDRRCVEPTAKI